MPPFEFLAGVYAAAVTPLQADFSPALEDLPVLLDFLAHRGCHGALLLGTTGEGPSFAPDERLSILRSGLRVKEAHPSFRLLVGTGTPSLAETVQLTRSAFDMGVDGVVVLPPYYYRKVTDDGLFAWYRQVLQAAVPAGKPLLAYHIPQVSGVGLSLDLLGRLKEAFPDQFAGLKDSTGDPNLAVQLGERFGKELVVLTGNDRLFSLALQNQASGCITAMANLCSPLLRQTWEAFQHSESTVEIQAVLDAARATLDQHPPMPPALKAALAAWHGFPQWPVRPPLLPLEPGAANDMLTQLAGLLNPA